ncbi:MAG TPA: PIN domain-containing protein [Bryobacteraceae bacterium]|nr:PIN domain-containing protein [Bryobacteraceae bacterium]
MIVTDPHILIDTNILVYLYDVLTPDKQSQALVIVRALEEHRGGAVSTQVLSEFFSVATSRLRPPLSAQSALSELERHVQVWTVLQVTADVVLAAARAVRDHQLNFWDAQLWAAAKVHGIGTIFSEDFNSGSTLGGVRFINPFEPRFHLPKFLS